MRGMRIDIGEDDKMQKLGDRASYRGKDRDPTRAENSTKSSLCVGGTYLMMAPTDSVSEESDLFSDPETVPLESHCLSLAPKI